jgi:hypothetical protein
MLKKILTIFLIILNTNIQAATYVQLNGVSIHDASGFNGFNYGIGIEQTVSENWNFAAGWYKNSEYRGSTYAYGRYTLHKTENWDFGVGVGLVTGYKTMNVMPMIFPEICYEYFCGIFIPKVNQYGANAFGLHLRIPIN